MDLALIKNGVVVNVIVVDGDGSEFLAANPEWAAQFDEVIGLDEKMTCSIGDVRTGKGFEALAPVVDEASMKAQAIELYARKLAIESAQKDGIDVAAELKEIDAQIAQAKQ